MNPEIAKAVESGKLTVEAGNALEVLQPGSYCLHKSWGFGRVESLNFLLNQAVIDFKAKKGHAMQLQYAGESLQPLPPEHILSQKESNLEAVKAMTKENPSGLLRLILQSYGGRATQDQIAQSLAPEVLKETEFKKWWDSVKKVAKSDGHFSIPSKKSDPVLLREEPVARDGEMISAFQSARQLKEQLVALDQILKNIESFRNTPEQLAPILSAVENSARKNQKLQPSKALELLLACDELVAQLPGLARTSESLAIDKMLQEEAPRLIEILEKLPAAKIKRVLMEFPNAFGETWSTKALLIMQRANLRLVTDLARVLQEKDKHEELGRELNRWIREHSITTEVLTWLCRERNGTYSDLISPDVFSAIISALERDQFNEVKRGGKLHDLLLEDRELIPDLLSNAETSIVRDVMRKLLLTPVFDELNKRSVLGRIVRVYPEMESMLTGGEEEKQEALVVSWESLEKRKNEYEELVTKRIPENTKEISVARSYGDLRENFEFKAAKEMQRVLMRRKSETERELSNARGYDFSNPDTTQVSIGTIVSVKRASGVEASYTLLGAWDSEPEKNIISYLAGIGQALLGKKVGDAAELPTESGTESATVLRIEAYKK
jgi:transcription elongation GreA/GreB family factor